MQLQSSRWSLYRRENTVTWEVQPSTTIGFEFIRSLVGEAPSCGYIQFDDKRVHEIRCRQTWHAHTVLHQAQSLHSPPIEGSHAMSAYCSFNWWLVGWMDFCHGSTHRSQSYIFPPEFRSSNWECSTRVGFCSMSLTCRGERVGGSHPLPSLMS